MGGEGSMQAMKTILENNRSLLRKKRMFDEKSSTTKNSNTKLEFKEIAQEDLEKVKQNIRKKAQQEQRMYRLIFVVLAVIVITAFYFLMKDFRINFNLFFRQV